MTGFDPAESTWCITCAGGPPPADAKTAAEWDREYAARAAQPPEKHRVTDGVLSVLFCPTCMRLRFGLGHFYLKLAGWHG